MSGRSSIFAYPSNPEFVAGLILSSTERVHLDVTAWPNVSNWGEIIIDPIKRKIEQCDFFIADITKFNLNVTYEIGYAIGLKKPIFLTLCGAVSATSDEKKFRRLGIFDTIGYEVYENTEQLIALLHKTAQHKPLNFEKAKDKGSPVYIAQKATLSDSMSQIVSKVKKSRLKYRSFNPSEQSRLSAIEAIAHVSKSYGVVVPLASNLENDSEIHNMRCSFIAGLSHGMGINTLILQPHDGPLPADYRDFVHTYSHPQDINDEISAFAIDVLADTNEKSTPINLDTNTLTNISFGDSMAENELEELDKYYLKTDQFNRAKNGEVNLVVGRKGTGKTALFSQLRNLKRANTQTTIVVDLKPEGYQLQKLKEKVIRYLSLGTASHVISAFWEYVLTMEVAYKVLEKDSERHLNDHTLYDAYRKLQETYHKDNSIAVQGDFSERLKTLAEEISEKFELKFGTPKDKLELNTPEITELIHKDILPNIRKELLAYLKFKNEVWLLFDNIDKGWNSNGPSDEDITILICLLEASKKVTQSFRKSLDKAVPVIFLRNDVYHFLVRNQSDFGKESRAQLDWNDTEQLRTVIKRRLTHTLKLKKQTLEEIAPKIITPMYGGAETIDYLIELSMMRPRNLIRLFTLAKGVAVNRDHSIIEPDDITKAIELFSDDILEDLTNEIRDINPLAEDILLKFLGEKSTYKKDEILSLINANSDCAEEALQILNIMIYFGAVGLIKENSETQYIYDLGYNIKKFEAYLTKFPHCVLCLHPALHPTLEIKSNS